MPQRRLLFILILICISVIFFHYAKILFAQTHQNNVQISAIVPAKPEDYNLTLRNVEPPNTLVGHNQEITMEISYSSTFTNHEGIILEASWDLGTLAGESTANIELLEYVPNSAQDAYGDTVPIIDPINRKITWSIPYLPENQPQAVRFILRTNSAYTGNLEVNFPISTKIYGFHTTTPDKIVNFTYKYIAPPQPTSTPAPTLTPTPIPRFYIGSVRMHELSHDSAKIFVSFNKKAQATISYGTEYRTLSKQITSLVPLFQQIITLPELEADTQYFFRVRGLSDLNERQSTDYYTFRTAKTGAVPMPKKDSLIASSQNIIIFSDPLKNALSGKNILILPKNTFYTLQLAFEHDSLIKSVQAKIASQNILGFGFPQAEAESSALNNFVTMPEIKPGIFSAKLLSPSVQDEYTFLVRVSDYNGSFHIHNLAEIRISNPFTILTRLKKPIEKANVSLSLLNEKTKKFQRLTKDLLASSILHSNQQGIVEQVLPPGTYQAEINAISYKPKTITFTIGDKKGQNYPTVYLEETSFSLTTTVLYFTDVMLEFLEKTVNSFSDSVGSTRFYHLINFFIVALFSLLTYLAFLERIKLPLKALPSYLYHHLKKSTKEKEEIFSGIILDEKTKNPLPDVHIYLMDTVTKNILDVTTSNKKGVFMLLHPFDKHCSLRMFRRDYLSFVHKLPVSIDEQSSFYLKPKNENETVLTVAFVFVRELLSSSFELLLFATVCLQILFAFSFGLSETWPFIFLSLLNVSMYIHHRQITTM